VYNFKKFLAIIITSIVLFGVTGCSGNVNRTARSNSKAVKKTVKNDDNINLNKLNITYPSKWTKRGNENEIFFDDENKHTVGGISMIGYYGNYNSTLPNHSTILNTEDIDTGIGKGKLFTINRSNSAAANDNKTLNEIHAIIPANKNNLAYDIWVDGNKDTLLNILKSIR
jgi:hypothetical protein